ncbi:MAG TPA: hypothetical protein VGO89_10640 [Streptomyces sp.]|jgi:hypothetical protein|nr:hypothetical protein [Streptomyces sp.]
MRKIALMGLLLALLPRTAQALNPDETNDLLSYVAMPLAVSAVCDVRGVQTDRVGELVGYMNRASVAPADFVDVFRYVPVALILRTDGRPDFVEWVRGRVDTGVVGVALVSEMETRLRTWDDSVPVSRPRAHRRYSREDYAYAYEPDYVPVVIRRHCERLILEPLSLVEMPVAVSNVCDLGVPTPRVSSLVVELNLGEVPALQFVELLRYAPAALVVERGSYGQPDFVEYVRTQRVGGVTGYSLVQTVDRRLRSYDVVPVIDPAPIYVRADYDRPYSVPAPARYWVDPGSPVYVPPVVRTRVTSRFAAQRVAPGQAAPPVAVAPQVGRLLGSPNGGVVASPGQARRELARANRGQREAPVAFAQPAGPPQHVAPPGRIVSHGPGRGQQRATDRVVTPAAAGPPQEKHGRGPKERAAPAPMRLAPAAIRQREQEHGRGAHGQGAPPRAPVAPAPAPAPAPPQEQHGKGHAKGREGSAAPQNVAPAPHAAPPPAPAAAQAKDHGHGGGHGGPPPAAAAPAPAPAAPQPAPPGQEKKNGKGKH